MAPGAQRPAAANPCPCTTTSRPLKLSSTSPFCVCSSFVVPFSFKTIPFLATTGGGFFLGNSGHTRQCDACTRIWCQSRKVPQGPTLTARESDDGLDSHELRLAGLQAVPALVERPRAFCRTGTASRDAIGLCESSGRGFNYIKPIFLSTEVHCKPAVTSLVTKVFRTHNWGKEKEGLAWGNTTVFGRLLLVIFGELGDDADRDRNESDRISKFSQNGWWRTQT